MHRSTIGALVGAVFGLMLAVSGGVMALVAWTVDNDTKPPENGIATTAVIVDSVERSVLIDGIPRPTYAPVYEYVDTAGRLHRVVDGTSSQGRPPTVGSEVEISYLPGDPESTRRTDIDRSWVRWLGLGGLAMIGFGSLITIGSATAGIVGRRRSSTNSPTGRPGAPHTATIANAITPRV